MTQPGTAGRHPWPFPGPPPGGPQQEVSTQQTLADLGEFDLIDLITRDLPEHPRVALGPGDDAAVVNAPTGQVVCTVDALVEGIHFRRDWSSALDIGRKAVAVNAADIEAMGARQLGLVMAFSAPGDLPVTWVRYFIQGVREECVRAGTTLIGGDITSSRDVTISITALGELDPGHGILRSGARPGQDIAIRGRLGWAAAGLAALSRGFRTPKSVVAAQQAPEPPYGAGREAAQAGATSLIDVSDGLLADLGHVAERSGVSMDLRRDALEVPEPLQAVGGATGTDPYTFVLAGGEDHALAGTFDAGTAPPGWTVIGTVTEPSDNPIVTVDGEPWEGRAGYDHFH